MKLIIKLLILAISNALALWVASNLISGFNFASQEISDFLWVGLVLGLVNGILCPILKIVTLPLRLLTLGLFTVIINLGLLYLVAHFFSVFRIEDFWAGLWGLLTISLVNYLISSIFPE